MNDLRRFIYASRAREGLTENDAQAIQVHSGRTNALDGITGVLIFTGRHFVQLIEGAPDAITDLVIRLERDPRHSRINVLEDERVRDRAFPSWDMLLIPIPNDRNSASKEIVDHLPGSTSQDIREKIGKAFELCFV